MLEVNPGRVALGQSLRQPLLTPGLRLLLLVMLLGLQQPFQTRLFWGLLAIRKRYIISQ